MKILTKLGALGALLFMAVSANATVIKATYQVETNQGSALIVKSDNIASNPFEFDLNAGESKRFDLFTIYTDEESINHDDLRARDISVDFGLLLPTRDDAAAHGQTVGQKGGFFGGIQQGHVSWDDPIKLSFGPNGDGLLEMALSDADFNKGYFFGTTPGECWGATIDATISLLRDASPAHPADVPEPNVLMLFALALAGLGFAMRRRRCN